MGFLRKTPSEQNLKAARLQAKADRAIAKGNITQGIQLGVKAHQLGRKAAGR